MVKRFNIPTVRYCLDSIRIHPKMGSTARLRGRVMAAGNPSDEPLRKGETQSPTGCGLLRRSITLGPISNIPPSSTARSQDHGILLERHEASLLRCGACVARVFPIGRDVIAYLSRQGTRRRLSLLDGVKVQGSWTSLTQSSHGFSRKPRKA